jgi:hypothetical protein
MGPQDNVVPLLQELPLSQPLLIAGHVDLQLADAQEEEAPQVFQERGGRK